MRLLLINFAMDEGSPVLAWQQSVAARLAARCERVVVMTEVIGRCELPANVEIHRVPRLLMTPVRVLGAKWLMNLPVWRWCAQHRVDAVFVHMNSDWVYRLAPCWRHFNLPVLLWYAHGTVTDRLHKSHAHASCVVTSSAEGFRIPSPKVRVIGQGIDTGLFTPAASRPDTATIVSVGRISRRKSLDLMIDTMAWLRQNAPQVPFVLRIIGPMLTSDDVTYAGELRDSIQRRGLANSVFIEGPRLREELPRIYASAWLHLNLSRTGSLDKTILESLACGCPTLTSNQAAFAVLDAFPGLIVRDRTADAIGARICDLYKTRFSFAPGALRQLIVGRHDLDTYVDRLHGVLTGLAAQAAPRLSSSFEPIETPAGGCTPLELR